MLLRVTYSCVFLGVLGSGLALGACSSDNSNTGTGAAGTPPNTSGSTAVSGNGSGGSAAQGGNATSGTSTTVAGTAAGGMSGGNTTGGASGGTAGGTTPGGASGSGGGGTPSKMSAGCGKDNQDDPKAWTGHDITVTVDAKFTDPAYKMRHYWTRPPAGYDKSKPIPLTLWGQGCGQNGGAEDIPTNQSGAATAAVQVELLAPQTAGGHCYSAGPDGDDANSPELPYFDKVLEDTLANFCIDTSRIFMGGYSSGGWVSSLVACNRADKVRGVAWSSAGLQLNHAACTGRVAAMIMRGVDDTGTPLDQTIAARDDLITRNGCTMTTKPWDSGDATIQDDSCVEYQGCMPGFPVVWCPVPGGHVRGDTIGLSNRGFWKFWSTLP